MLWILYIIDIFGKDFLCLLQENYAVIKKIFIGLIVVVALAVGSLSAYISTIDWNKHKDKIAEQLENITGKKVVFGGSVSLSIFPTPYLTAKDIKIYNKTGDNTNEPLAIINEMVTDLNLQSLLKGNFVVNNMSLINPTILIELLPDGKINWYSEISDEQKSTLDEIEVALNSVMLKDASVQIINKGLNMDINLQNLNAEITAQSLRGPYRIDGNFVKDNNPAGFALTLGTFSESFATSLNLVLTHPSTESYARFDGSMLTSNNEIKGNFIVESKNPSTFINELTNQVILPEEFNYPLAFSVELNTNNQQIDLSSFIIKYGDNTAGAGNILIPLIAQSDEKKRVVEVGFEMTDLDLQPIVGIIKEQLKKYDGNKTPFEPFFDFDMIADIKAVKATYNNQPIRNFTLSADLVDDVLNIKTFSGLFPGDADITVNGDVFEHEKVLSYNFKLKGMCQDFLKFMEWLDIKPKTYTQSTYRNAQVDADISGNLNQIRIMPLSFTLDKISANGVVGIIRNGRLRLFVALGSDTVDFDNYAKLLNEDEQKLSFAEKVKLILNEFAFLNNVDLHFETKIGLGIYNKIPFKDIDVFLDTESGVIKIQNFSIGDIAGTNFNVNGTVSGLGVNPSFENIKYDFKTTDFKKFTKDFEVPLPNLPLIDNANNVQAKGIFTGDLNNATIKSVNMIEKLNSVYSGKLYNYQNKLNFNGMLEFKTPDFTQFIKSLGFNYNPKNMASNIFTFKGNVEGNPDVWKTENFDAFVGTTNFKGKATVDLSGSRPKITTEIASNKFEFNHFFYNPAPDEPVSLTRGSKSSENNFLVRPLISKSVINYDFFKTFDLKGKFNIDNLNFGTKYLEKVSADVDINKSVINFENLQAVKDGGNINGQVRLDISGTPKVKGKLNFSNFDASMFGGKKYGFVSGTMRAKTDFESSAESGADFIDHLNGKISFDIDQVVFKGWDMEFVEDDLSRRTHSDNLIEMLQENLQKGETSFELVGAEIDIKNSDYTFKDALMASGLITIDVSGKGSIKNWNTDTTFKVVFERLRDQVVPIDFKWTGALNNPNLVVNSTELKNKYDAYWEKIAKEKKAAEEARIKALNDKMSKTQKKVLRLKDVAVKEIFPKIEEYKPLSSNADIKSTYDSNHLLVIDINNQLDAMQQKAKGDFTDNDITEMNAKLETFDTQLQDILKQINENFVYDVKVHAAEAYGTIVGIYENSKIKAVNYQKTLDAYVLRLLQLGSLVVLDRDPRATDYKSQVETSLRAIEDLNLKANELREQIEETNDIKKLDKLYKNMQNLLDKTNKELEKLNSNMEALFDYAKQLVREEEHGDMPPEENSPEPESAENTENNSVVDDTNKTQSETPETNEEKSAVETSLEPITESKPEVEAQEGGEQPLPLLQQPETTSEADVLDNKKTIKPQPPQIGVLPQGVVSYQSKSAPSGTITRGKQILETGRPAVSATPANGTLLLKPISGENISSGGTIKKKD